MFDRRSFLIRSAAALGAFAVPGGLESLHSERLGRADEMLIRKTPGCMCCDAWASHLAGHGIDTRIEEHPDLDAYKDEMGVPEELRSCHTGTIGDYVVEGHIPGGDVLRLLAERPDVGGIAVPGMPVGSPGMEAGDRLDPYEVIAFGGPAGQFTFARHG